MSIDKGKAELQVMRAHHLGNVVTETDRRIRINGSFRNVTGIFSEAVLAVGKTYARQVRRYKTNPIVIEAEIAKGGASWPRAGQGRRNMICGVARDELVEQCRGNRSREPRHHAYAGILEGCLNGGESGAVGPQRNGILLIPGVVNVVEAGTNVVVDVVIDPEQLLTPVRGKRGGGEPLILEAVCGHPIRLRNQRTQRGGNRGILNGHLIIGEILPSIRLRDTVDKSWNNWALKPGSTLVAEVPRTVCHGGNYRLGEEVRRNQVAAPLFRPKEECLLSAFVVMAGNIHRPSDGETEVVLLVLRGRAQAELSRVKIVVAHEFVQVAVEVTGAGLGLNFDCSLTILPILRAVIGGQHLELGNRIDGGIDIERGVAPVVQHVTAVQFEVIVF